MQRFVKTFAELTVDELYRILAARAAVFVVEQKCPYQDVDGVDRKALHVWREEDGKILCYLRAFPIADDNSVFQIGRVHRVSAPECLRMPWKPWRRVIP